MNKQWAKRDGELLSVLEATSGLYGDLQAIAGQSLKEIDALEGPMHLQLKAESWAQLARTTFLRTYAGVEDCVMMKFGSFYLAFSLVTLWGGARMSAQDTTQVTVPEKTMAARLQSFPTPKINTADVVEPLFKRDGSRPCLHQRRWDYQERRVREWIP